MKTRKEMKKIGKKSFHKHYIMFVFLCILLSFVGAEFQGSLELFRSTSAVEESSDEAVTKSVGGRITTTDVIANAMLGKDKVSEQDSKEIIAKKKEEAKKDPAFGRTRGVLASAVNAVSSGSIFVTIFAGVVTLMQSRNVAIFIFVIFSLLLGIFVWFFVHNMLKVVVRRVFLEGMIYDKVAVSRLALFFRVRQWSKIAWVMFVTFVYQMLWNLTIVGGLIKSYSYAMVPYIMAENPEFKAKEAITLSRNMMKGHKWECFVLDISFLGWHILGAITIGLSDILYKNPYIISVYCEYYKGLRTMAKDHQILNADRLNDSYLYEKASKEMLKATYEDVEVLMEEPELKVEERHGVSRFFANVFGVVWKNSSLEKDYERNQVRKTMIRNYKDILSGDKYPGRLFSVKQRERIPREASLHYLRHYTVWSVVLMFFSFSLIGWLWEVSLHLVEDGIFVNRGVLHGPWLPIYGAGGILILLVLNKFRANPPLEFLSAVFLCGCVEYGTSYYLQVMHHGKKWWDYSGYYLNLNGRICAEGLLVFGLGGMVLVYLVAPALDNWIRKIKPKVLVPICLCLVIFFGADQVYSSKVPNEGKGITDYQ